MKMILRIAKFELSTLFYSPIAWLILIIFMVQCSITYSSALEGNAYGISMGFFNNPLGVTSVLFSSRGGLLAQVLQTVYFYIPLLTMGLISRELSSGSIKLLMSSPITATQFILGKYFAILGYVLLMTLVLLVYLIASLFSIESADWGLMFSCLLSFFLLTAVYAAIGLFLSSLTSYQVIAAIGTLSVLGILNFIGRLGQGIPVLEDITYWLSISGRALEMIRGLISTHDVLYFIIIAIMFLGFAILKITLNRQVISKWGKVGRYATLFGAAGICAYLSSIPALVGYLDASRTNYNTLTKASQKVLNRIDSDITMTSYINIFDFNSIRAFPKYRNDDKKVFRGYTRYIPQLKFEYVYFYYDIEDANFLKELHPGVTLGELADKYLETQDLDRSGLSMAKSSFLTPEQIEKQIDLSKYGYNFVREFSYKGKKSYANMLLDNPPYPLEQEMMATFKHLLSKPSKITYLTGHGERDYKNKRNQGYFYLMGNMRYRHNLINKGFDIETVNLANGSISQDTDILFIAAPTSPYSEAELSKIKSYLDNGGSALILAEPEHRTALQPIANYLGVSFIDGQIEQDNPGFERGDVVADFTPNAQVSESLGTRVWFPDEAMGLRVDSSKDYQATSLFQADKASLAFTLTKEKFGKEQRIMIVGNAGWLSNQMYQQRGGINIPIMLKVFGWLTNNEYPVVVDRPVVPDLAITMDKSEIRTLRNILVGVIPFIIFVIANIILIRRRRN